jgi:hypothetical protein
MGGRMHAYLAGLIVGWCKQKIAAIRVSNARDQAEYIRRKKKKSGKKSLGYIKNFFWEEAAYVSRKERLMYTCVCVCTTWHIHNNHGIHESQRTVCHAKNKKSFFTLNVSKNAQMASEKFKCVHLLWVCRNSVVRLLFAEIPQAHCVVITASGHLHSAAQKHQRHGQISVMNSADFPQELKHEI